MKWNLVSKKVHGSRKRDLILLVTLVLPATVLIIFLARPIRMLPRNNEQGTLTSAGYLIIKQFGSSVPASFKDYTISDAQNAVRTGFVVSEDDVNQELDKKNLVEISLDICSDGPQCHSLTLALAHNATCYFGMLTVSIPDRSSKVQAFMSFKRATMSGSCLARKPPSGSWTQQIGIS